MLPWQGELRGLGRNFQFFIKHGPFLAQNVFISKLLAQIRNQGLKIDPCAKFKPDYTKDKRAGISIWIDIKYCLMTSYLPHSDDVSQFLWLLKDFFPEYHHGKFGGNWTTSEGETGGQCAPLPIFYKNSPA